MNKNTLTALVVFVALGAAAWYVLKKPPKGQRVGKRPRPVAEIAKKDIAKLTLQRAGTKTVVLTKGKDGWSLEQPVKAKADKHAVDQVVEKLSGLAFGDLVTEQKKNHAEHKVGDKSGVHVVAADKAGKTLADFWIGKVSSGFTMLRPNGKDAVWQAVGAIQHSFKKDVKDWRDRTIFSLKRDEIIGLDVTTATGTVSLSRKDSKTPWKIDKAPMPIAAIEMQEISSLVSTIYGLSAYAFADGAGPDKTGLDKPRASVSVKTKDGKTVVMHIGKNDKDDFYVKRADSMQVFVLKRYTAEQMIKRPIDFRSRQMLSFKADDVVSLVISKLDVKKRQQVTFTRKGKTWLAEGKKVGSDKKVKTAINALARLKADRWAHHDAKAYGLDKPPAWIFTLTLKGKKSRTLKVGETEKDGFYGVELLGEKSLYSLRKFRMSDLTLEPKNYK